MRRILLVCLAIVVATSLGCGKKETETGAKNLQKETRRVSGGSLIDPVDKKPVDISASKYSYIYEDMEYNFNSKENMEAFMKDPDKYLKKKEE